MSTMLTIMVLQEVRTRNTILLPTDSNLLKNTAYGINVDKRFFDFVLKNTVFKVAQHSIEMPAW